MENFDEKTLDAVWTVDSETGQRVLIDSVTGLVIAVKDEDGNIQNG